MPFCVLIISLISVYLTGRLTSQIDLRKPEIGKFQIHTQHQNMYIHLTGGIIPSIADP